MERPKWIPRWVSVSLVVFIIFLGWMLFFGEYNLFESYSLSSQKNDLTTEIQAMQDSAIFYDKKVNELNTDRENLEKIAREQYGMRRVNEEIYTTDIP
ncbi:MAG: septum formation initiator family protein [Bacteroidales bacterium]|uniref:FtsB family cell division protein n=1 Tax=Sodaliphilus sp. TaxID=2815818 RepID=UPI001B4AD8D6|nr:septum formation initiator family protein [Candidatus Sodaliphilus limicaballi]